MIERKNKMKYVGSKNKLSKELAPIIQSYITKDTKGYLEPFVGGANMIDKIQCKKRIGCDIHEELIELLKYTQQYSHLLPERVLEDTYNEVKNNKEKYEKWFVGLVGFTAGFGAKYFGGHARNSKDDNTGNKSATAIRGLKKQAPNLEGIDFRRTSFIDLPKDKIKDYVIYCDIPYRGTTKYKTEKFPYEEFYQWVKDISIHNIVLISEYNMPEEFECIWAKETKVNFDSNRTAGDKDNIRIEKLFTYKTK
jgi:site-specific DNA-adenine methylase